MLMKRIQMFGIDYTTGRFMFVTCFSLTKRFGETSQF